ncbi:hypothetical protein V499_00694 [Pseudogymnoascus sp. VKM F-103]|nr:hypothetical protein V499_00694 [Pseudogymnoascus sp. VKM F-103]
MTLQRRNPPHKNNETEGDPHPTGSRDTDDPKAASIHLLANILTTISQVSVRTYSCAISSVGEIVADGAVAGLLDRNVAGDRALALEAASEFVAGTLLEVVGSGVWGGDHIGEGWNWVGQDGRSEHEGGREGSDEELDESHFGGVLRGSC